MMSKQSSREEAENSVKKKYKEGLVSKEVDYRV